MAKIISIGSGKGGSGKSVVSSNIATSLAMRGKNVVLVDLDIGGANSHILFGLLKPERTLSDFLTHKYSSLEQVAVRLDAFHGLRLICGTGATLQQANMPWATKRRMLKHIRELDADYVLVDVGAGTSLNVLDFFIFADHHLCVTTSDPTSILDLYRFIKLSVLRRSLSAFLAHDEVNRTLSKTDFRSVQDIYQLAAQIRPGADDVARHAVNGFQPSLILNMVRKKGALNLIQLKRLLQEFAGVSLPVFGEIPDTQEVQNSVLQYQPVVAMAPRSEAAKVFFNIADTIIEKMT